MELLKIKIVTDGGPWAQHNYPCPVCRVKPAVINVGTGRFNACWSCQDKGWQVCRPKKLGLMRESA